MAAQLVLAPCEIWNLSRWHHVCGRSRAVSTSSMACIAMLMYGDRPLIINITPCSHHVYRRPGWSGSRSRARRLLITGGGLSKTQPVDVVLNWAIVGENRMTPECMMMDWVVSMRSLTFSCSTRHGPTPRRALAMKSGSWSEYLVPRPEARVYLVDKLSNYSVTLIHQG